MIYEINDVVSKIGQIAIQGNVIPNEWYIYLRNEKGKTQTNAALILADIVYWYRPIPIYDIQTSELTGYGKKFKEDLLQLSYKYFNDKFGFSQSQTRNALIFLEDKGLIFREFRNIVVGKHILNNVMHIGIYPEKISEITGNSNNLAISSIHAIADQTPLQLAEIQTTAPILLPKPKVKEKDWSAKFTAEQKEFLNYLLSITPEVGDPIEKDYATWWIKSFGIEKIKTALQVYWQRVEKAKQDSTVPMPKHIGKYVRKALNDGILPLQSAVINEGSIHQQTIVTPCSENSNQVVEKIEPGAQKNKTTYTNISMTSMIVNEINDERESLTFQKEEDVLNKEATHSKAEEIQSTKPASLNSSESSKKAFRKSTKNPDWTSFLTLEEKKFLAFLLSLKPEIGDRIEEKHATFWIKHFGIEKIKIALQVYWQQVEKAKKNSKVPMPESIGAYVREALNKGTQPCREAERRNKAFAEQFKKQIGWGGLTITEKYCRAEEIGKEWHYNLPEAVFVDSLKNSFENYCSYTERQNCVA